MVAETQINVIEDFMADNKDSSQSLAGGFLPKDDRSLADQLLSTLLFGKKKSPLDALVLSAAPEQPASGLPAEASKAKVEQAKGKLGK
jgi:hypothetical protein